MKTKIEWATDVWNPVTGCTKVSEGCRHCYAETIAKRFWGERKFTDVQCHPDRLDAPLHWKKPRRVFVNSMSDLFHQDVPEEFIWRVFNVMLRTVPHTYIVLTKRPERMELIVRKYLTSYYLDNIWFGVTVENQKAADERIPYLLQTPAVVRFVSVEPMLGEVDIKPYLYGWHSDPRPVEKDPGIDWVICGGETGPGARPMHPDWARSLRDQCTAAGVPFFFKKWGEWAPDCLCDTPKPCRTTPRPQPGLMGCMFHCGAKAAGRLLDGREWNEIPEVKNG